MKIRITHRAPSGVLIDLEGREVKPDGKATLSLTDEQLGCLATFVAAHTLGTVVLETEEPK